MRLRQLQQRRPVRRRRILEERGFVPQPWRVVVEEEA
jgi:hypothetical protein